MADNELDDFGDEGMADDVDSKEPGIARATKKIYSTDDDEKESEKKKFSQYAQWSLVGDGVFTYAGKTVLELGSAAYSYFFDHGRAYVKRQVIKTDELLEFPDSVASQIIEEIEKFWDSRKVFHKYKFLHKRGYILYGQPGCGKTGIIQLLIQKVVERDGLVILVNSPEGLSELMSIIRAIEPNRHVVCIIEDIDATIRRYGDQDLLSFLDGENQVDDILTIATTNYPETLDRRIISRPRRFDRRIKILPPNEEIRRAYFEKKGIRAREAALWASKTDRFTFAGMTDLVIQVKCLDVELDKAIETIHVLTYGAVPSSSDGEKKPGFGG